MSKAKKLPGVDKTTGEMKPKKFWSSTNAHMREKIHERGSIISRTVPNQCMTVLEMIRRHRQGLPIEQSKGPLYQGDELKPNLDDMDLVDRQAYIDSVADHLVEIRARIDQAAKSEKDKEFLAKVDEEVRKRMKEIRDKTNADQSDDSPE